MGTKESLRKAGVDHRVVLFSVAIIVIIGMLVRPIGLPLSISEHAKALNDAINDLPPGSTVIIGCGLTVGQYVEEGYTLEALFQHILREDCRWIVFSQSADAQVCVNVALGAVQGYIDGLGKVYGVDYVDMGYTCLLDDAGLGGLASNLLMGAFDDEGTALTSLPLMQDVTTAADISIAIEVAVGSPQDVEAWWRQWTVPYDVPLYMAACSWAVATMQPYYPVNVKCILNSMRGSAEYLLASGYVDKFPVKSMDVLSLTHITLLACIILGNIVLHVGPIREFVESLRGEPVRGGRGG
jgi:hypothetical protein